MARVVPAAIGLLLTLSATALSQTALSLDTVLDSEFGIVRLQGDGQWLGFRDVVAVDGVRVPDRDERLDQLFADASSASGLDRATTVRAARIVRESARFNIGTMQRTINNPAVVLELLGRPMQNGEATYTNYRQFRVESRETFRP